MTLQIEPIQSYNVEDVVALLLERNNTLPSYTRWKYNSPGDHRFRGVVARLNGKPVGCFGSIPRDLKLSTGEIVLCNWFADWYVLPDVRGKGVGVALLEALSADGKPVFGHPGPVQAQALCRANGYCEIGFQSRRRLVFRKWEYERKRTHYFIKALSRVISDGFRSGTERYKVNFRSLPSKEHSPVSFIVTDAYRQWVLEQPVSSKVSRSTGNWIMGDTYITYMDDTFETGEVRRRVLYYSNGNHSTDSMVWSSFVKETKQNNCDYMDVFTTSPQLDFTLMKLGAWRIPESPVLVKELPDTILKFSLHGWDRENWLYLAGQVGGE